MKKKSVSRSAFFNPRVLIGLSVVVAGVLLALAELRRVVRSRSERHKSDDER